MRLLRRLRLRTRTSGVSWPDGSQIRTQRYKHDFTTKVLLDGDFNIVPTKGALFIPYQLDVLLDTKNKFPKVTAIQFIA